jgi:shikimate kinase
MKSYEFIEEGIEDKGIFKSIFLSGLPGAGKSTVISKVTDGTVAPRIVSTDRSYEHLLTKNDVNADATAWALYGPLSKTINQNMLFQYLNGMLPIYVDGTSANTGTLIKRSGILESIGYDTMMIYVNVDLETAIERVSNRTRHVDTDFIKRVHKQIEANKTFYQSKFGSNYVEIDNNSDNFAAMENQTFSIASKFFTSPIANPMGVNNVRKLRRAKKKYLTPTVYDPEYIKKLVDVWYQK